MLSYVPTTLLLLSVQVMRLPGVLSQTPLQADGAAIVQTAMMAPLVLYEVNFQFLSPTWPTRSMTRKPNSWEYAKALTTVCGAGRSVLGLKPLAGRAESRLSPPLPATNVAGWLLEKSNAWKSCTCPCIASPMFGG